VATWHYPLLNPFSGLGPPTQAASSSPLPKQEVTEPRGKWAASGNRARAPSPPGPTAPGSALLWALPSPCTGQLGSGTTAPADLVMSAFYAQLPSMPLGTHRQSAVPPGAQWLKWKG
jgi:hypothetical protein